MKSKIHRSPDYLSAFMPLLYFTTIFFYILWRLDPPLFYQCQVPPFLWDDTYLHLFLDYPGGPVEYLSHLFSQFFYYPIAGAMILTACLVLTFLLSRAIIKRISPDYKNSLAAYIPSMLILILSGQYEHRLSFTLAWLSSQIFILAYLMIESKSTFVRFFVFIILLILLYYIGAGFFLLFAISAILLEILYKKNLILGTIYFAVTLGLPWPAQNMFILTTKNAYFYLLLPTFDYRPFLTPYVLHLYFPLFIFSARTGFLDRISRMTSFRFQRVFAAIILFLLTGVAALVSFDAAMYRVLKVDSFAYQGAWQKLLTFVEKHPSDDILVAFQTNRALSHLGRLSSEMFSFNQNWGVSGLFLPDEARKFFSIQVSDLYWDMAFLNEAEHWAQEDHTNYTFGPRHLQRLAAINILKGNASLAAMALAALTKSILYQDWANEYKKFIEYPGLVDKYSQFVHLRDMQSAHNFIITAGYPARDIEMLLAQTPQNKTAFEYLMANYLLSFRLDEFVAKLASAPPRNEPYLPRHYQEAILVYLHSTQWKEREFLGKGIHPKTIEDFNDFANIIQHYRGDAATARAALQEKYGHTYWYYSLYNNPEARSGSAAH